MTSDQRKTSVITFFNCFTQGDAASALELLDETVVWRAMGTKGEMPLSGQMGKEGIGKLIASVKASMPEGLRFNFTGWTIENDRVAVEIESYGQLTNGKVYNNFYHFLIEFQSDKILVIKEYMDTLHVQEIFLSN